MSSCTNNRPAKLVVCSGCGHVSINAVERIEFCINCLSSDAEVWTYVPEDKENDHENKVD